MHTHRYITKHTYIYVYTHTQSDLAGSDKGREMMDASPRTRTDMLCAEEQGSQGMLPSRLLTPMHHHAHTVSSVMSPIQMSHASHQMSDASHQKSHASHRHTRLIVKSHTRLIISPQCHRLIISPQCLIISPLSVTSVPARHDAYTVACVI